MRKGMKSWKRMHIDMLEQAYGQRAARWALEKEDDRAVFCRMYSAMLDGLHSLPEEPQLYVKVAVAAKLRKDRAVLDRIAEAFEDIEEAQGT